MNKQFTFIDLFSGIGGFKIALTNNGGKCLKFSEINKDAIKTYCENYKITSDSNLGDITNVTKLPKHDLLTAGVPCQSWSIAGRNLGFDDDRGQLWNDTIYLLNQSKPKAFIFENVKGLVDPRNSQALSYILTKIKEAGYFAKHYIINSHEYGVPQNRVRVYIIGFLDEKYFDKFRLSRPVEHKILLSDILNIEIINNHEEQIQTDLFGDPIQEKKMSLSSKNGFNDYFLFNDLRNGYTTIHSWDILDTTKRQKEICILLLRNRRKSLFGPLDGNPLSLEHFQNLDKTITENELQELVELGILKQVEYRYEILSDHNEELTKDAKELLNFANSKFLVVDKLKVEKIFKLKRISITNTISTLLEKHIIKCVERRFEFKNTKISSGLNGINRVFMPRSDLFPTLVASDTNDYVALKDIPATNHEEYKKRFLEEIYFTGKYRKITKEEACLMQGFPKNFNLPKNRSRWMKLIGNSVSVPVIDALVKAIISTGVFDKRELDNINLEKKHTKSLRIDMLSA